MKKHKNQALQHYYKAYGRFTPIYHHILKSPAFRALTPKARCLLLELQYREFPNRNGRIGFSENDAAKSLGCAPNTASKAFQELIDKGFVERSFDGDYTRGLASEWILTYLPYKGREPTNDWRNWKSEI